MLYLFTGWTVALAFLVWGFGARVLTGPSLSPIAQLVTRKLTPWVEQRSGVPGRLVAGSPKRFAQGIGLALSSVALLAQVVGERGLAIVAIGAIAFAATLESVLGFCLGCVIYGYGIRLGLLKEKECAECANLV